MTCSRRRENLSCSLHLPALGPGRPQRMLKTVPRRLLVQPDLETSPSPISSTSINNSGDCNSAILSNSHQYQHERVSTAVTHIFCNSQQLGRLYSDHVLSHIRSHLASSYLEVLWLKLALLVHLAFDTQNARGYMSQPQEGPSEEGRLGAGEPPPLALA